MQAHLTATPHQLASMTDELESHIENTIPMSGELTTNARNRTDKLNELARTDTTTGLGNKRAYEECIDALDARAAIEPLDYTAIMLDLNHPKHINDIYGREWATSQSGASLSTYAVSSTTVPFSESEATSSALRSSIAHVHNTSSR